MSGGNQEKGTANAVVDNGYGPFKRFGIGIHQNIYRNVPIGELCIPKGKSRYNSTGISHQFKGSPDGDIELPDKDVGTGENDHANQKQTTGQCEQFI